MERALESPGRGELGDTVAAVDLGSNSFHMIVVRRDRQTPYVVDRIKESVRLGAGLTNKGTLDDAACARALACLARFGQRLEGLAPGHVRAVGTNTLRRARGAQDFIERASAALGHPIEVIYGAEEARLIYAGVVQDLGEEAPRRLVVDIGGGSTEIIIGEGRSPWLIESLSLGAVAQMRRFFPDGRITRKSWQAAVWDARIKLEPIARAYYSAGWDQAIGASGSIKSILSAAAARTPTAVITPAAIGALTKAVLKSGRADAIDLAGVAADRRAIFPGGLAVLAGVFESLGIERMAVSDKALREGVIADLLGRLGDRDTRETGVVAAGERYSVDAAQGERVAATANRLLETALAPDTPALAGRYLRWAARLHEIGLVIAHKGYHKHGEYILRNADLQGFSQTEQAVLATVVRLHRGRFRDDLIAALPRNWRPCARRLTLVLRVAVIFHRGRDPDSQPRASLRFFAKGLKLTCQARWLAARPLTRADLDQEAELLKRADIELRIKDIGPQTNPGERE